ncbi:MAG: GGDEF domain-containing protein [Cocleimonas sp.]|nr:GGDEF domain-containing protein [Cocleimonas sp.]
MNSKSRINLLSFVTTFLMILLAITVATNLFILDQLPLALIGSGFLSALLYAGYLCKSKGEYEKPAWIVSIVLGVLLYGLILDGKGTTGAYSLVLFFPIIIYPLLGLQKGNILYFIFGILVWFTTLYGTQNWGLHDPYLYLLNISLTLFVGGIVVYHAERISIDVVKAFHKSSITDPLTGLWNRKMSDDMLDRVTDESIRYEKNYSMILLDIDFFKKINDKYGHHVGDKILVEFAKIVQENTRKSDMLFRWGGEEFLIILPNTNAEGAATAADKILEKVRNHQYPEIKKGMTVSAGVAENTDRIDKDSFFQRVDKALYQAKDEGRDRYVLAN